MKLSALKEVLGSLDQLNFQLPDGTDIPQNFHVTEVGLSTKDLIDCGGKCHTEQRVVLQLWNANDYDHRLQGRKLLGIIALCERTLNFGDLDVVVEYQGKQTIGTYGLYFREGVFQLTSTSTACRASSQCGEPETKPKVRSGELETEAACCSAGGACCR